MKLSALQNLYYKVERVENLSIIVVHLMTSTFYFHNGIAPKVRCTSYGHFAYTEDLDFHPSHANHMISSISELHRFGLFMNVIIVKINNQIKEGFVLAEL